MRGNSFFWVLFRAVFVRYLVFEFVICQTILLMFVCLFVGFFLRTGDEILVVNGKSLQGMKHDDAINVFKSIKIGDVVILIGRRAPKIRKTNDTIDIATTGNVAMDK